MTLHQAVVYDTMPGVARGAAPKVLEAIRKPDCAAAIWQREPLKTFQDWIDSLDPHQLPSARMILRPGDVPHALTSIADSCGLDACDARTMLIEDIGALAHIFATVMEAPFLRLRLSVVNGNSCRKFHSDLVKARLICTYRGPGTQFRIAQVGRDAEQTVTTPTGSPIVLRGQFWPATGAPELLHRSPPIDGTGETRLVLVLDPITDRDEARRQEFLH